MALAETTWSADQPQRGRISNGQAHSQAIKKALQAKRIALKHLPEMMRGIVQLAQSAESEQVRKDCMIYVTERAIGKTAMAPEDLAV